MSIYESVPYTNFHDLNADWIINQTKAVSGEWQQTKEEWEHTQDVIRAQLAEELRKIMEEFDVQYVLPEEFGAVGDDTHDDSEALQAALDYCFEHNAELRFPVGKIYRITSPIQLKWQDGHAYRMTAANTSPTSPNIRCVNTNCFEGLGYRDGIVRVNVVMDGLAIRSNGGWSCFKGISLYSRAIITRCKFYDWSYWIEGAVTAGTIVSDCRFQTVYYALITGFVYIANNQDINSVDHLLNKLDDTDDAAYYYYVQSNDGTFFSGNYVAMSKLYHNYVFAGRFDTDFHVDGCWFEFGRANHLLTVAGNAARNVQPTYLNCVWQQFVAMDELDSHADPDFSFMHPEIYTNCKFMGFRASNKTADQLDSGEVCGVFMFAQNGKRIFRNLSLVNCRFINNDRGLYILQTSTALALRVELYGVQSDTAIIVREDASHVGANNVVITNSPMFRRDTLLSNGQLCPRVMIDEINVFEYPDDATILCDDGGHIVICKLYVRNNNLYVYRVYDSQPQ